MVSSQTLHHPSKGPTTICYLLSLKSPLDCFPPEDHIPFLYQAYKVHLEKEQCYIEDNNDNIEEK